MPLMVVSNISRCLALCLVPHFSSMGVGPYETRTHSAALAYDIGIDFVRSWHREPGLIEAFADSVLEVAGAGDGRPVSPELHVIFTAHSLPQAAVPAGDPYQAQLLETAALVAARIGLASSRWRLAYQGAVVTGQEWLGPSVEEAVASLAAEGARSALVCPIGFVLDQVETLFDLDVLLREQARRLGLDLARPRALNDGEPLAEALAGVVERWQRGSEGAGDD